MTKEVERVRARSKSRLAASVVAALSVAASAGLGSLSPAAKARAEEPARPNVLVIVTDDQRADNMMVMPKTMEWLGEGGTRFTHAVTPVPLCCPARASLFTGRYLHNHDLHRVGQVRNFDESVTVQRYLKDAGYHTGMVGKYFIGWNINKQPPYFDDYSLGRIGISTNETNYFGATWNVNGEVEQVGTYSTEFTRRRSLSFLRRSQARHDDRPWFLYVAPAAPHPPMIPAKRYERAPVPPRRSAPAAFERDRSDKPPSVQSLPRRMGHGSWARRRQLRTLMSVDDMVDSMMQWLDQNHELENTLVIFTSDNGFLQGEHGIINKGFPYTESVAVPLLMRWPEHFDGKAADGRLTSLIDIAPTVLDAADVEVPAAEPMDGRSLLGDEAREHLLIEYVGTRGRESWASIRTDALQYVEYYDDRGVVTFREYYDLIEDPYQLTNLLADGDATNNPVNAELLSAALVVDKLCKGATCP